MSKFTHRYIQAYEIYEKGTGRERDLYAKVRLSTVRYMLLIISLVPVLGVCSDHGNGECGAAACDCGLPLCRWRGFGPASGEEGRLR